MGDIQVYQENMFKSKLHNKCERIWKKSGKHGNFLQIDNNILRRQTLVLTLMLSIVLKQ